MSSQFDPEFRYPRPWTPEDEEHEEEERPPPKEKKPQFSRQRRRFQDINRFLDEIVAAYDLSPAESLVWLTLWRDTRPDGIATSSQKHLGVRCNVTERHARRAVDRLKQLGLLELVYRGGKGRGASKYRVILPAKAA